MRFDYSATITDRSSVRENGNLFHNNKKYKKSTVSYYGLLLYLWGLVGTF